MKLFQSFQSRAEKRKILIEIISNLHVWSEERDMYALCIDVLDDADFEVFFKKITSQILLEWEHLNKNVSIFT